MPVPTALDGLPRPPCAELLGWEVVEVRPADGWIRLRFEGRPEFVNPAGYIQGGFLAAMLDDTMGPAMFVYSEGRLFTPTIEMHVSFLAPARPGPLYGEGQVVQAGRSIAFLEGRLMDLSGTVIARATATARLVPSEKALAA
ncbi:MAG: phenylacetic acid degradation protein [Phenylobacterium sp. RIFCSPHIGHO2_01_FULL_69_31]|uniref:PaaI family thioesterase n=1 Tax=Phenylobacterium sp. RIFCSPHIGHO2_01_FULL_69_31 TaxID=1801944 RepID=UPI0008C740E0|nr:PaaI family thioesterase [Phenylobacterium sp. RIFCSPHIGHO2_01_FULL_69_31]OHB31796.1 MAG: phenylacetic acid degradation protein [Phenylobacterium sp. RIFCSPHIGHO2_01_FULL_69_31]